MRRKKNRRNERAKNTSRKKSKHGIKPVNEHKIEKNQQYKTYVLEKFMYKFRKLRVVPRLLRLLDKRKE